MKHSGSERSTLFNGGYAGENLAWSYNSQGYGLNEMPEKAAWAVDEWLVIYVY